MLTHRTLAVLGALAVGLIGAFVVAVLWVGVEDMKKTLWVVVGTFASLAALIATASGVHDGWKKISDNHTCVQCWKWLKHTTRRLIDRGPVLIGQKSLVRRVSEMMNDRVSEPRVLYISSFSGTGKSYLLNYLLRMGPGRHRRIAYVDEGAPFVSALKIAFPDLARGVAFPSPRAAIVEISRGIQTDTVLLVDDFQHSNVEFVNDFLFFTNQLGKQNKHVVIVCTSRDEPSINRDHFEIVSLDRFGRREIVELLELRLKNNSTLLTECLTRLDDIERATAGNPKLIEYLCTSPGNWDLFKRHPRATLTSMAEIADYFGQAWAQLGASDPRFQGDLKLLATVGRVDETLDDALCSAMFGPRQWAEMKRRMTSRRILEHYPGERYKYHDLFAQYVYDHLRADERTVLHRQAAERYKLVPPGHGRTDGAFRHYLSAAAFDEAFAAFQAVKPILLEGSNLPQTVGLIEELSHLAADPSKMVDAQRQADLLADIAWCMSMIGTYDKAMSIYDKLSKDYLSNMQPSRRLEILLDRAFVLHCQGQFTKSLAECRQVISSPKIDSILGVEGQCLIAHCLAHLGELREAEREFGLILDQPHGANVQVNILWGLAWVKRALGEFDLSLKYAECCLSLATPHKWFRATGLSYWNLATVARLKRHYPEAEKFCRAAAHDLHLQGLRSELHVLHEEAEISRAMNQLGKAREIYSNAMHRATTHTKDFDYRMHAKLGWAETLRLAGEFDASHYTECLHYFTTSGIRWAALSTKVGQFIGEMCFSDRPWDEAVWRALRTEAADVGLVTELETLDAMKLTSKTNHLHPLTFM